MIRPLPRNAAETVLSPDPHFETATDICDYSLEVTRKALIDRDFDAFVARCHFPQIIGTFEGERTIENAEAFRPVFQGICTHLDTCGVIDLRRRTVEASFINEDTVTATFESCHVQRGYRLSDAIIGHGLLRRVDGRWLISDCRYATGDEGMARALISKRKP